MSDQAQGPGWWQASDGKWYPPPAPQRDAGGRRYPLVDNLIDGFQAAFGVRVAGRSAGEPPPRLARVVAGLVVTAVIVAVIIGALSGGGDDSSGGSDDPEVLEATAFDSCKEFIGRRVAGPTVYPDYFDHDGEVIVTHAGDTYTVRSHVEGENAFGGPVRQEFTCTVRDAGDDQWQLVSLEGI
jgi:hypothetical protein